jgi:hypothetical protein
MCVVGLAVHHLDLVAGGMFHIGLDLGQHGLERLEAISIENEMTLELCRHQSFNHVDLDVFCQHRSVARCVFATFIKSDAVKKLLQVGRQIFHLGSSR